ncbi:hypothetical protein CALVIDRAFT_569980, partial [Calocera viscosa TUFC12733]
YLLLCLSVLAAATTYHLGRRGMRKELLQLLDIRLEPIPWPPTHHPGAKQVREEVSMICTRAGLLVMTGKLELPGSIRMDKVSTLQVCR